MSRGFRQFDVFGQTIEFGDNRRKTIGSGHIAPPEYFAIRPMRIDRGHYIVTVPRVSQVVEQFHERTGIFGIDRTFGQGRQHRSASILPVHTRLVFVVRRPAVQCKKERRLKTGQSQ